MALMKYTKSNDDHMGGFPGVSFVAVVTSFRVWLRHLQAITLLSDGILRDVRASTLDGPILLEMFHTQGMLYNTRTWYVY